MRRSRRRTWRRARRSVLTGCWFVWSLGCQFPLCSHCLNTQRANPELVKAEEMMKRSMEVYEKAVNGLSTTWKSNELQASLPPLSPSLPSFPPSLPPSLPPPTILPYLPPFLPPHSLPSSFLPVAKKMKMGYLILYNTIQWFGFMMVVGTLIGLAVSKGYGMKNRDERSSMCPSFSS